MIRELAPAVLLVSELPVLRTMPAKQATQRPKGPCSGPSLEKMRIIHKPWGKNAGHLPAIDKEQYDRESRETILIKARGARNTAPGTDSVSGTSEQKGEAAHPSQKERSEA